MPVKKGLGRGLATIMSGQKSQGNKILNTATPILTEKLIALEKARRIKEVEKIPFLRRYASPKEATAFHDVIRQLREINESVQIEHTDMESAKRVLALGKGQVGPRIRKSDVQAAINLLKKYGPQRTKPRSTK